MARETRGEGSDIDWFGRAAEPQELPACVLVERPNDKAGYYQSSDPYGSGEKVAVFSQEAVPRPVPLLRTVRKFLMLRACECLLRLAQWLGAAISGRSLLTARCRASTHWA